MSGLNFEDRNIIVDWFGRVVPDEGIVFLSSSEAKLYYRSEMFPGIVFGFSNIVDKSTDSIVSSPGHLWAVALAVATIVS